MHLFPDLFYSIDYQPHEVMWTILFLIPPSEKKIINVCSVDLKNDVQDRLNCTH